jgi:hypothetical protein
MMGTSNSTTGSINFRVLLSSVAPTNHKYEKEDVALLERDAVSAFALTSASNPSTFFSALHYIGLWGCGSGATSGASV